MPKIKHEIKNIPHHTFFKRHPNKKLVCYSSQSNQDILYNKNLKELLNSKLNGINRGIFGIKNEIKEDIINKLELLEKENKIKNPVQNLEKLQGKWQLLFSTITITGSKRTKLGLRGFITLGDFIQEINIKELTATNKIGFSIAGLSSELGSLTIIASFKAISDNRVQIQYKKSIIEPNKLNEIFENNLNLLLTIFNPEGWLDITYIDEYCRIGRDDKGNIFYLQKI